MKLTLSAVALACVAVLSVTAAADAKSSRTWNHSRHHHQRGHFDYDYWASRHSASPADRTGAGNFKNLTPPAGGAGRVNSHTQN